MQQSNITKFSSKTKSAKQILSILYFVDEPYFGSGSGSGGGTDDEDDDEGSGLGSQFTPTHNPDQTDRPPLRVNNVDDEDEDAVEERTHNVGTSVGGGGGGAGGGGGGSGGSVQTYTSRPAHPHNTNTLEEDDDRNDPETGEDLDYHLKASGSAGVAIKISLRRALFMYLMPLYIAWFGGIIADML